MSLGKRFFAWILKKGESINHRIYRTCKRDLFQHISGSVVEIGPGTGINFRYLPAGTEWIGVEPNTSFHPGLYEQAKQHGINAKLVAGDAQKIPLHDNSVDTVLCTLVLCSVPDPFLALAEIRRVLKPGGRFVFIEHVAAPANSTLRTIQNLSNPFNRLMADGCNCNRETWVNIETSGFRTVVLSHNRIRGSMILHAPHITGFAIK